MNMMGDEKRMGCTVHVELFGLPVDSRRGLLAHKVKAASFSLFNVIYADEAGVTYGKIVMPQLAMLHITVLDEQAKLIGHRVLPLVGLRPGYKYVNLKDEANRPLNMCTLLVHLKLNDYVPEEHEGLVHSSLLFVKSEYQLSTNSWQNAYKRGKLIKCLELKYD